MNPLQDKATSYGERWLFYWTPLFAYCVLVFALSAQHTAISVPGVPSGDKLLHLIEYSMLGFLMARAFFSPDTKRSQAILFMISFILSVLFAFSDEIHQYFVPDRTASLTDVMADGAGALIGTISYWTLTLLGR